MRLTPDGTIEIEPDMLPRLRRLLDLGDEHWRALMDLADSQLQLEAIPASGWPNDGARLRIVAEGPDDDLRAALTEAERVAARAQKLRQIAVWRCVQRTRDRDIARTAAERMAVPAEIGRAVMAVIEQIERLRMLDADTMPFGLGPSDVAAVIVAETDEVEREEPGSPEARAETADVLAAALHLSMVHGSDLIGTMHRWADKMRRRLDLVVDGHSWADAKAIALRETA